MKAFFLFLITSVMGFTGYSQTNLLSTIDPNYTQYLSDEGVQMNGVMYYLAANSTYGTELWRTDGTAVGTYMLKDINPGHAGAFASSYFNAIVFQGYLYFVPRTPNNGFEIWRTDGTSSGTNLFYEMTAGPSNSSIGSFSVVNNRLLFVSASNNVVSINRLNVTVPSVTVLKSFETIYDIFSMGTYAVFSARQTGGATGTDLWRTDGTPNGTYLLKDINPGAGNSFPSHFTKFGNLVMFDAFTDTNGYELWKTDGSAGGTAMIADIYRGVNDGLGGFYGPPIGVPYGKYFYFGANNVTTGLELWRTDGTVGNATRLTDVNQGSASSLQLLNGIHSNLSKIIFRVQNQNNCYSVDTATGIVSTTNFKSGYNVGMYFFDGIQYYADQDSVYGDELRKNDGITDQKIQELSLHNNYQPFYTNSSFRIMGKLGSKIIFRHLSWQGTQYRAYEPTSNTCFAPDVLRTCFITSTRSDIIWNRIPGITRYQIDYKLTSAIKWISKISYKSFSSLTNLLIDSSYVIRLRAECNGQWTPWSTEKLFVHKQIVNGYNANVIAERNQSPTSEIIFWNKNPGTTSVQIRYRPYNSTTWIKTVGNFTSRCLLTGLLPNTFYEYEIRGFSTYWDTWRKQYFTTTDDLFFKSIPNFQVLDENNSITNIQESIWPNPAKSNSIIKIRFTNDKEIANCRTIVTDFSGRIVFQKRIICTSGKNVLNISTNNLSRGTYGFTIIDENGNKILCKKLIIQ